MATAEEFFSLQRDYWRQVAESEGFDLENVLVPLSMIGRITGLIPYNCESSPHVPYRILVKNYATVGIHRYNMLQGTNFKFNSLTKVNMSQNIVASYFMTLGAYDTVVCPSGMDFQVRIDEKNYSSLDLTVSIARPKGKVTPKKPFIPHFHGGASADGIFKDELPDWPSKGDLKDQNRFYVVKESELRDIDWISTYLHLVICAADRTIYDFTHLSQLNIMEVVIETSPEDVLPPNERLKAKCANVYISFKGLFELRAPRQVFQIGVDRERKAIVRRVMDDTGYLTLLGKLYGGVFR